MLGRPTIPADCQSGLFFHMAEHLKDALLALSGKICYHYCVFVSPFADIICRKMRFFIFRKQKELTMNLRIRKRDYLQRSLFISLFPLQAVAVGLPAINTFVISLIVGNYMGPDGLAAMGFLSPITNLVAAFVSLLGTGLQILSGRALGKGDSEGVKKAFSTSLLLGTVIGLTVALISLLFSSPVIAILGATGQLKEMTAAYLRGYTPSLFLIVFSSGFLRCLQMDNERKLSYTAIVVQILSSILLSLLFMVRLNLGLFGIGLALSCGNLLFSLICSLHFLKSDMFRLSFKYIDRNLIKETCALGVNSSLVNVWLFIRNTFLNHVLFALGGSVAVSAMAISFTITNATCCAIEGGMRGSTEAVSSVLVGERDVKGLRGLHKTAARFTYPLMIAMYALLFVFAKPLALLFGAEADQIAIYVMTLRIYHLWTLVNPLKEPIISVYGALGRVKLTSIVCCVFLLIVPSAVIAISQLVGSLELAIAHGVISDILMYATFVGYYIVKARRLPKGIFNVTYIPRDFSVPKKDTFVFTVKTAEDAASGSVLLTDFCKKHDMDEQLSLNCGLCLEEISVGTLHRFPEKNRQKYKLEVRGFFEDGHLSLMFHDNLPAFDPQRAIELYHPEEPGAALCFKIVSSFASDMKYSFTLGMNTLIVKL